MRTLLPSVRKLLCLRKLLSSLALLALGLSTPAFGDYYLAGDFNGWNASGNVMTDLGGGIWQANLANVSGRHELKVTAGDWSSNWPGTGNSWFYGDDSGNVTITFNANDISDGWRGNWGRLGTRPDPGTWTAVGDWQGWNNVGNVMTSLGGGVYRYEQILAPGWYQYKAVVSGSWDAIGDDFRSTNANTTWFEVTADKPLAVFEVNALAGIERAIVTAVPEPSTVELLGVGLIGLLMLRRRRQ